MVAGIRVDLSDFAARRESLVHGEIRRRWTLLRCGGFMIAGCLLGLLFALREGLTSPGEFFYFHGVYVASLAAGTTGLAVLLVVLFGRCWRRTLFLCLPLCHGTLGMLVLADVSPFWPERMMFLGAALVIGCLFGMLAAFAASTPRPQSRGGRVRREVVMLMSLTGAAIPWVALAVGRELQLGYDSTLLLIGCGAVTWVVAVAVMRLMLGLARMGGAGRLAIGLLVGSAGASALGLVAGACLPTSGIGNGPIACLVNAAAALLMLWLVYENKHKLPIRTE